MIAQLKLLEQTFVELKERYHITATELVSLKNKISQDTTAQQLSVLQDTLNAVTKQLTDLQADNRLLEEKLTELYEQNESLVAQNKELAEKNVLAISRAQVIQEWLAKIDNADV